jgi:hypothetical protein
MEYYQTTTPLQDNSGLSGGVGFKFGEIIATNQIKPSQVSFNYAQAGSSSGHSLQTYDLQICVDGVPKTLQVYVVGDPS